MDHSTPKPADHDDDAINLHYRQEEGTAKLNGYMTIYLRFLSALWMIQSIIDWRELFLLLDNENKLPFLTAAVVMAGFFVIADQLAVIGLWYMTMWGITLWHGVLLFRIYLLITSNLHMLFPTTPAIVVYLLLILVYVLLNFLKIIKFSAR